ncbi:hypothetical protein COV20_04760 [Candidatus Woesearchaeota archaeon CG10_big_fil_rev_8_21_14_0_10_45_16]|nr:MAG: hypothetical protein COV20_04760 [Candidatus Woesearchaeota archaeon CG10_big_fil_rev_8_21_14_0_10_45_16]
MRGAAVVSCRNVSGQVVYKLQLDLTSASSGFLHRLKCRNFEVSDPLALDTVMWGVGHHNFNKSVLGKWFYEGGRMEKKATLLRIVALIGIYSKFLNN